MPRGEGGRRRVSVHSFSVGHGINIISLGSEHLYMLRQLMAIILDTLKF